MSPCSAGRHSLTIDSPTSSASIDTSTTGSACHSDAPRAAHRKRRRSNDDGKLGKHGAPSSSASGISVLLGYLPPGRHAFALLWPLGVALATLALAMHFSRTPSGRDSLLGVPGSSPPRPSPASPASPGLSLADADAADADWGAGAVRAAALVVVSALSLKWVIEGFAEMCARAVLDERREGVRARRRRDVSGGGGRV